MGEWTILDADGCGVIVHLPLKLREVFFGDRYERDWISHGGRCNLNYWELWTFSLKSKPMNTSLRVFRLTYALSVWKGYRLNERWRWYIEAMKIVYTVYAAVRVHECIWTLGYIRDISVCANTLIQQLFPFFSEVVLSPPPPRLLEFQLKPCVWFHVQKSPRRINETLKNHTFLWRKVEHPLILLRYYIQSELLVSG